MTILAEKTTEVDLNIDDLLTTENPTSVPFGALLSCNLGNRALVISAPVQKVLERSEVANERSLAEKKDYEGYQIAQRPLDIAHATKLAVYLLKGYVNAAIAKRAKAGQAASDALARFEKALGKQPYLGMQPMVANIRTCKLGGDGLKFTKDGAQVIVNLSDRDVLWIIDGQHRREAMRIAFDFLRELREKRRYPKRQKLYAEAAGEEVTPEELHAWNEVYEVARAECTVVIEVHLGLDADCERQLFHDLNNLGKKVEASLAFEFDNSNPINRFIKDDLVVGEEEGGFWKPRIEDKDVIDWHDDTGGISRKDLIAINAILFLNKTNIKGAHPADVERARDVAMRVWEKINGIKHFGEVGARVKTVSAQPVVLKAIGKLAYDLAFGKGQDVHQLAKLIDGIELVDFSHGNPMWQYYVLDEQQRKQHRLDGLADYLPSSEDGANRDIGALDGNGLMRFGAKHNDIYPIIGDMIRWRLGLPSRNKKG
jgi:DndB-like DNA-sulfur modification-associated protein